MIEACTVGASTGTGILGACVNENFGFAATAIAVVCTVGNSTGTICHENTSLVLNKLDFVLSLSDESLRTVSAKISILFMNALV